MSNFPKSYLFIILGGVQTGWVARSVVGRIREDKASTVQETCDGMLRDGAALYVAAVYAVDLQTGVLTASYAPGFAPDSDITKVPPEDRPGYATDIGDTLAALGLDVTEIGFGDDTTITFDNGGSEDEGEAALDAFDALGDESAKGETPDPDHGNFSARF